MPKRISKHGTVYQQSSTSGWGGWTGSRRCRICELPVLVKDTAVMRTEIAPDGTEVGAWSEHVRCRLIPGYPEAA